MNEEFIPSFFRSYSQVTKKSSMNDARNVTGSLNIWMEQLNTKEIALLDSFEH